MADIEKRRSDRWNFLFIAGMWFQDLFNYDFRRTERCIIPYATQEGEISFCAYNTGIGWRNIIEKMHMTATLTKWYDEHGRHEIFAGGKKVALEYDASTRLKLDAEAVNKGIQHDLDDKGIAKNAREEKLRARKAQHENERMAELYRQVVLKEAEAGSRDGPADSGARQEEGRRQGRRHALRLCLNTQVDTTGRMERSIRPVVFLQNLRARPGRRAGYSADV